MREAEIACGCADFRRIPEAVAQWWTHVLVWVAVAAVILLVLLAAGIVAIRAGGDTAAGLPDRSRGLADEPPDDQVADAEGRLSFFTWHDGHPDPGDDRPRGAATSDTTNDQS
ncbi:hypothetical protein ACFZBU_12210 [Embleya sp. NPDC008237]|uniref:hypothetical protein n=1 Tax=Embleya sp. NPDC008237 TaxID=3363978 RepID=UPI0036E3345D